MYNERVTRSLDGKFRLNAHVVHRVDRAVLFAVLSRIVAGLDFNQASQRLRECGRKIILAAARDDFAHYGESRVRDVAPFSDPLIGSIITLHLIQTFNDLD